jgi:hypothetical protein
MENFDFNKMKTLNFAQQKEYITKYFIPLTSASHCMLQDGKYEILTDEVIKKVYFNRFDKKIRDFYFQEHTDIKVPVYEINQPVMYGNKLNLCPPLPNHKPYKEFSDDIKKKVEVYFDFMLEVFCSNRPEIFSYLCKWISNVCKGKKNDCALVLKTLTKGVGKSTLTQMLMNHVLGPALCIETGSEPIKSKFNSILGGKLLVVFEELETFSASEWVAVDCVLKRQITSDKVVYQKKGQDAYEAKNINNYVLLSNHDISDDDRRYFVLDVQTHRKGDRKYWANLYDICFNDEVGKALYSYFREIDTNKFHPQDYPMTKNKMNSISKRLDNVYSFLKDEFILKSLDINMRLSEFYEMYKTYCTNKAKRYCTKTDFTSKLSEVQINYYKTNGYNTYKVKLDVLKTLSQKNNWINDIDEVDTDEDIISSPELDGKTKREVELEKQIEELKKQIEDLNNKSKINDYKEVVTETENDILSISSDIIIQAEPCTKCKQACTCCPIKLQNVNITTLDDIRELEETIKTNKKKDKIKYPKLNKKQEVLIVDSDNVEDVINDIEIF